MTAPPTHHLILDHVITHMQTHTTKHNSGHDVKYNQHKPHITYTHTVCNDIQYNIKHRV